MSAVKAHFRPEFLNRLDDIVIFSPLSADNLDEILKLQLATLEKRLSDRNIKLVLEDDAVQYILQKVRVAVRCVPAVRNAAWSCLQAYNPLYGARPLKRYLEKQVVTRLSQQVLSGALRDNARVHIVCGAHTKGRRAGEAKLELRIENRAAPPTAMDVEGSAATSMELEP